MGSRTCNGHLETTFECSESAISSAVWCNHKDECFSPSTNSVNISSLLLPLQLPGVSAAHSQRTKQGIGARVQHALSKLASEAGSCGKEGNANECTFTVLNIESHRHVWSHWASVLISIEWHCSCKIKSCFCVATSTHAGKKKECSSKDAWYICCPPMALKFTAGPAPVRIRLSPTPTSFS